MKTRAKVIWRLAASLRTCYLREDEVVWGRRCWVSIGCLRRILIIPPSVTVWLQFAVYLQCSDLQWLGVPTPISPFMWGDLCCLIKMLLGTIWVSIPNGISLNPSNGFSKVHRCDRRTDHATVTFEWMESLSAMLPKIFSWCTAFYIWRENSCRV